jgi:hypothetical protein
MTTLEDLQARLAEHEVAIAVHQTAADTLRAAIQLVSTPSNGNGHRVVQEKASAPTSTAAKLALFDHKVPRSPKDLRNQGFVTDIAVGPLVYHGYLRKKGDGYIRTAKQYPAATD